MKYRHCRRQTLTPAWSWTSGRFCVWVQLGEGAEYDASGTVRSVDM
jgi:hypothetical protein